jgi:hypothetical protein
MCKAKSLGSGQHHENGVSLQDRRDGDTKKGHETYRPVAVAEMARHLLSDCHPTE